MRKTNLLATAALLLAAGSALLFTGCDNGNDDEGGNGSNKFRLTVSLTAPEGYEAAELPDITVTATNADKELTYTETIAAGTGSAAFDVASGQYQITATGRYSATVTFTGAATADVFESKTATVKLNEVYQSKLIFKEIYTTSYNFKLNDTYFEIVNNSDEVQYLDQVIIGAVTKLSAPNPWVDDSGEVLDKYPLYGIVAAFPGTGKDRPLQPGQSVVVANDAKDWTSDGGAADLSGADWECYVPDAGQADADYDAPNLDIVYNLESQRRLGAGFFGGALVMAKLPDGTTPAQFAAEASNYMTEPNTSKTQLYFMIPGKYLLDAVEMFDADESTHYPTLRSVDDADGTLVTGWSGKSIRRKATKVENGRAYYQDTNNSKNDFLTDQPLTPGVHPSQAD